MGSAAPVTVNQGVPPVAARGNTPPQQGTLKSQGSLKTSPCQYATLTWESLCVVRYTFTPTTSVVHKTHTGLSGGGHTHDSSACTLQTASLPAPDSVPHSHLPPCYCRPCLRATAGPASVLLPALPPCYCRPCLCATAGPASVLLPALPCMLLSRCSCLRLPLFLPDRQRHQGQRARDPQGCGRLP